MPRHEIVEPINLVIGDAAKDVGQPGLRIDAVELGGLDQGVGDRSTPAAALGANEQIILPAQSHGFHRALGAVVVDLQAAMLEIGPQTWQAGQGVADRLGEFGFARDLAELGTEPGLQRVEDRYGAVSTQADPLLRCPATGLTNIVSMYRSLLSADMK